MEVDVLMTPHHIEDQHPSYTRETRSLQYHLKCRQKVKVGVFQPTNVAKQQGLTKKFSGGNSDNTGITSRARSAAVDQTTWTVTALGTL